MPKEISATLRRNKLAMKKIAFVGKFGRGNELSEMLGWVEWHGGTAAAEPEDKPDYLVAGAGVGGKPPSAIAKFQKKHPSVQIIDQQGFYQLIVPSLEEILEVIRSGPQKEGLWDAIWQQLLLAGVTLTMREIDFRGCTIQARFSSIDVVDCDFRDVKFEKAIFSTVKGSNFEGATMVEVRLNRAQDCNFKRITQTNMHWNPAEFIRCDFSDSKLDVHHGYATRAMESSFRNCDLSYARMEKSEFNAADLSHTKLEDACLEQTDFSNAVLTGANLTRADLRQSKFVDADLRNAIFRDAILSGANLSGARVDGADFTGAILTEVDVTGVDTSKAKSLISKAARRAGPKIQEMTEVASGSEQLTASIELALGPDENVSLHAMSRNNKGQIIAHAEFSHGRPASPQQRDLGRSDWIVVSGFDEAMLKLADMWQRGTPKIGSISVNAKKCPLRSDAQRMLALEAWCEAFGIDIPPQG